MVKLQAPFDQVEIDPMPVTSHPAGQDYEWLEFFAGQGNLTRMMQSMQYKAARFDVMDSQQRPHRKSNFMDMTHASGYAFLGELIFL